MEKKESVSVNETTKAVLADYESKDKYIGVYGKYVEYCEENGLSLENTSEKDLINYAEYLLGNGGVKGQGLAGGVVMSYLSMIRKILTTEYGIISRDWNVLNGKLKKAKLKDTVCQAGAFTIGEVKKYLDEMDINDPIMFMDGVLMIVGMFAGTRVTELTYLKFDCLCEEENGNGIFIELKDRKNKKEPQDFYIPVCVYIYVFFAHMRNINE